MLGIKKYSRRLSHHAQLCYFTLSVSTLICCTEPNPGCHRSGNTYISLGTYGITELFLSCREVMKLSCSWPWKSMLLLVLSTALIQVLLESVYQTLHFLATTSPGRFFSSLVFFFFSFLSSWHCIAVVRASRCRMPWSAKVMRTPWSNKARNKRRSGATALA